MAWLWSSWEEYRNYIVPNSVDSPGHWRLATRINSWFETEQKLFNAVEKINSKLETLANMGFRGDDDIRFTRDSTILDEAAGLVIELIYAGEELLFYHKRLATSNASYGFLHSHDIYEHWDRYVADGRRIFMEIDQLVKDTRELLDGYQKLIEEDERFLIHKLDLPEDIEVDFRLARDLFSVGLDDVGVLIAGRGLEGVLRRIAKQKKIQLVIKGKTTLASETDIYDLIETMSRLRWKATGLPFITKETKALLHYLRALRNEGAHSGSNKRRSTISPRETAAVVTETANQLWNEIKSTRARLHPTTIDKTW